MVPQLRKGYPAQVKARNLQQQIADAGPLTPEQIKLLNTADKAAARDRQELADARALINGMFEWLERYQQTYKNPVRVG